MISPDSQHDGSVAHDVRTVWVKPSLTGWSVIIPTMLHLSIITQ